jgi:threonine synthase
VVISALRQLAWSGAIKPDELTVAYITGNGLKTQEAVEGVVNPLMVRPTLSSFEEALSERTAIGR